MLPLPWAHDLGSEPKGKREQNDIPRRDINSQAEVVFIISSHFPLDRIVHVNPSYSQRRLANIISLRAKENETVWWIPNHFLTHSTLLITKYQFCLSFITCNILISSPKRKKQSSFQWLHQAQRAVHFGKAKSLSNSWAMISFIVATYWLNEQVLKLPPPAYTYIHTPHTHTPHYTQWQNTERIKFPI